MNNKELTKRDISMDALRVTACLMVIAMHVLASGKIRVPFNGDKWNIILFCNCAVHFAVPLFFMLSGAFSKSTDFKAALKKSLYFFIVFILSDIFYYFFDAAINGSQVSFWGMIYGIADFKYHLWFLLNMITVLLLSPVLNRLSDKEQKYAALIVFVFIVGFTNLSYLTAKSEPVTMVINLVGGLVPPGLLFCGYYLLGKILYEQKDALKSRKKLALTVFVATTVVCFLVNRSVCLTKGTIDETHISNYSIFVVIQSVCMFILFLDAKVPGKLRGLTEKSVPKLFAVYIIHVAVIEILTCFGITPASLPCSWGDSLIVTLLMIPLEILAVYIVSLVLAWPLSYVGKQIRKLIY